MRESDAGLDGSPCSPQATAHFRAPGLEVEFMGKGLTERSGEVSLLVCGVGLVHEVRVRTGSAAFGSKSLIKYEQIVNL